MTLNEDSTTNHLLLHFPLCQKALMILLNTLNPLATLHYLLATLDCVTTLLHVTRNKMFTCCSLKLKGPGTDM